MTGQQQLNQLPDSSRALLEAAALLDQPFSVSLLIDLGFSVEALDPLFDNGIFGEPFPTRAEFRDPELRNELLGRMPWSKKRRFCEQVGELLGIAGILLTKQPISFAAPTVIETLAFVACRRPSCPR